MEKNEIKTGALPLIMGNYASSYGVNLFMYGNCAYTDGKNITIPRLDFFNKEEMNMAYGYVAHECGHIKYSDFGCIKNCQNEYFQNVLNALEDVRIEYCQSRNWPGLAKTFSFLVEKLEDEVIKVVRKTDNLSALLLLYISSYSRTVCLTQPAEKSLKAIKRKLKKLAVMPESSMVVLDKLLSTTTSCKHTDDVWTLTNKVLKLISQIIDDINSKFENKSKQNQEQEQEGEGSSQSSHNSTQHSKDEYRSLLDNGVFSPEEFEELYEKMTTEMEFVAESIDGFLDDPIYGSSCNNVMPNVATLLEKTSRRSKNAVDIGSLCSRNSKPADNLNLYYQVLKDNSLKCNIQNLARGYELWHQGNNSNGRVLDIRAYANSFRGKLTDKIFKKKVIHKEMNTTIHLLVDTSGSMSRPCNENGKARYQVANHMALSLAMGMEGIRNLTCKVSYFPGNCCEYEDVYQTGQPLVERATYFDLTPRGCTPLAQTLLATTSKMGTTDKYHRNIIVVITDGEPDNYEFAQNMIQEAENKGIEVHALRISGRLELRDLFKSCIDVKDASELPEAMKKLLSEKIFSCR